MALHIDSLRDLDGWGDAARGQVESRLSPPAEQLRAVETLLRAGMTAPAIARAVHWPVEAVRREAARLKLDASSGIAPVAALVEPESPQSPLPAPTAVATPADDAEAIRPAENAPQVIVERAISATPAPALPAWVAEARAAAPDPLPPRRRTPERRPSLLRAFLAWLAPAEGEEHAPLPWRRLLPWAGGGAAAVVLLMALLPHGPSSVPLAATTPAPSHYRCTLPSGAVVLTVSAADCSSVIEGIAAQVRQAARPQQASTAVSTAPQAAPQADTAPVTTAPAAAPVQQPQTAQPAQKAPATAPSVPKQAPTATASAPTAAAPSVTTAAKPVQTVSFGPATVCYSNWWGGSTCHQAAVNGQTTSGIPASVKAAVCAEEHRTNCGG